MRPSREPWFGPRWAALVAVAGGLLGILAFPRFGIWPAAFVSVALLSVAIAGRRARTAAWLGFLYGAAFMLPLLHWTGVYVGPVPWLILSVGMAAFYALLGAVLVPLSRLPAAPVWIGAAWVLEEALRDRVPFGGFPWGRLAFSQAESPVRWFAALGGAPLVTFVVAVGGAGLAGAALDGLDALGALPLRRPAREYRPVAAGLGVLVLVPVLGGVLAGPLDPAPDGSGRTLTVAVVQGGLPNLGLTFEDRPRQVLDNHVKQTLKLAAEIKAGTVKRPDLVIWPENSSDLDPYRDPSVRAEIDNAVRAVGVPVLVGAILQNDTYTKRSNVGILWSPTTGPGATYTKRHPVPFAEYIPLRGIAQAVSSDAKTVEDMVAGSGNGLLTGGPAPIGDVICFEVAYDGLVRSSVTAGAQLLVVQTNNATFGYTPETYQQLAMAQLRAVENGRTVVQAATTGKSAIIGPDGGIRAETGALFTSGVLVETVPLRSGLTLATRVGAWPEYLLSALAVAGVVGVLIVTRRSRSSAAVEPPQAESAEEMVKA